MMSDGLPPGPAQSLLHSKPEDNNINMEFPSAAARVMERRKSSSHHEHHSHSKSNHRESPKDTSLFESVKKSTKPISSNRHRNQMRDVLDVEDIEDFDDDNYNEEEDSISRLNESISPSSNRGGNNIVKPFNISEYTTYDLDIDQEKLILKCILGKENRSSDLPESWAEQGFYFNDKITYGLIQNNGGPCGVIGVVQAYIIKNLLYTTTNDNNYDNSKKISVEEMNLKLHGIFNKNVIIANSLADIFWKVSENNNNNMTELCLPMGYKKYKFISISNKDILRVCNIIITIYLFIILFLYIVILLLYSIIYYNYNYLFCFNLIFILSHIIIIILIYLYYYAYIIILYIYLYFLLSYLIYLL